MKIILDNNTFKRFKKSVVRFGGKVVLGGLI